jgi:hypothetical protein
VTDDDRLAERVATLERALGDGPDPPERADGLADRDDALEERLATIEADLAELEAGLLAVRGYVGQVRHVNREVERTAETALAVAERATTAEGLHRATDVAAETGTEPPESPEPTESDPPGDSRSTDLRAPAGNRVDRTADAASATRDHGEAASDPGREGEAGADGADDSTAGAFLSRVRDAL